MKRGANLENKMQRTQPVYKYIYKIKYPFDSGNLLATPDHPNVAEGKTNESVINMDVTMTRLLSLPLR